MERLPARAKAAKAAACVFGVLISLTTVRRVLGSERVSCLLIR